MISRNVPLLHNTSVDTLVNLNSDGSWGNIPDNSSLSVVLLVWHTLLDLTSSLDINKVSQLVGGEVFVQSDWSMFSKRNREQVAGSSSITE